MVRPGLQYTRARTVEGKAAASRRCSLAAFGGLRLSMLTALAEGVAARLVEPRQLHEDGLALLRAHVAKGHEVVVVTATYERLAEQILARLDLPTVKVLGTTFEDDGTGLRMAHHNYGEGKSHKWLATQQFPPNRLYTDSWTDIPLAKLADVTTLIHASRATTRAFAEADLAFDTAG